MLNINFLSSRFKTAIRKSPELSGGIDMSISYQYVNINISKDFDIFLILRYMICFPCWHFCCPACVCVQHLPLPQPWCSPLVPGAVCVWLLAVHGSWSAKGSHTLGEGFAKTKPRTLRQEAVSIIQSLYFHCKGKTPFIPLADTAGWSFPPLLFSACCESNSEVDSFYA